MVMVIITLSIFPCNITEELLVVLWAHGGPLGAAAQQTLSAAPPIEPDNKEIVKLKAFPAAVSGGRPHNTRARIMYQVLDSMWGGRIQCVISLQVRE